MDYRMMSLQANKKQNPSALYKSFRELEGNKPTQNNHKTQQGYKVRLDKNFTI